MMLGHGAPSLHYRRERFVSQPPTPVAASVGDKTERILIFVILQWRLRLIATVIVAIGAIPVWGTRRPSHAMIAKMARPADPWLK